MPVESQLRRTADTGARKYLQWLPFGILVFALISGWFTLVGNVTAQDQKLNSHIKEIDRVEERVSGNSEEVQELKTQTAVIRNTQENIQRTLDSNQTDLKAILKEVRKR